MNIQWTRLTLPHDKANHLIGGFVVALVMTAAARGAVHWAALTLGAAWP